MQELGREPTPEEVAKVGIEPEKALEIIKISQEPVTLETPVGDEEDSDLEILFMMLQRLLYLIQLLGAFKRTVDHVLSYPFR